MKITIKIEHIFTSVIFLLFSITLVAQPEKFLFGVDYYPEQWPEDRMEIDMKMMQEAGINCVRIGELSWSMIEPIEGQVSFEYFDNVIAKLSTYDINVVYGTCSRTPPPWVFSTYPEILNIQKNGLVNNYGHRYTVNLLNPKFIELSRQIDAAIIRHYAGNQNVIGWQIDNEIGSLNEDYSDYTKSKFHAYLEDKYKTVENLNTSWGAHFWSFVINDFSEVPLPTIEHDWGVENHPGLMLDWNRFNSKVNTDFALWRRDLIKIEAPGKWMTTNFQHSRATHTDIFELGKATDIYGINYYPPGAHEFGLDLCRGSRGELLVLEQRSGQPMWDSHTEPGMMRLWAWNSIAHGANGIFFYRWRPTTFGQEEYWHGVLPHSGNPNKRYKELQKMGEEISKLGDLIVKTKPASEVAILMGYDSRWALDAVLMKPELSVEEEAYKWHEALMANHVTTDAVDPREDLSNYKMVIAPRLYLVDSIIYRNLESYVRQGGNLVITFRSGVVDQFNKIHPMPAPGLLSELAGVEVDDYGALTESNTITSQYNEINDLSVSLWADEIKPTSAEVVANYKNNWLKNMPAVTINKYVKGRVFYIGTHIERPYLDKFVEWLLPYPNVISCPDVSKDLRVLKRSCDDYELLFLVNFSTSSQTINLNKSWQNLFTNEKKEVFQIPSHEVVILKNMIQK